MRLFAFVDGDVTFRHTLWHVLFSFFSVLDGLAGLITLGFGSTLFSVAFVQSKWGVKLYDHQADISDLLSKMEQLLTQPDTGAASGEVDHDAIRKDIAGRLGIDPNEIEILDVRDDPMPKLGVPKSTEDKGDNVLYIPSKKKNDTFH